MDNPAHALIGLMMSRCGLGKTLPKGGAILMMLAANAPDADLVATFSSVRYLEFHRGFTHSLSFSPLVALLPLLLVCGIGRIRPTWQALLPTCPRVLSHFLFD